MYLSSRGLNVRIAALNCKYSHTGKHRHELSSELCIIIPNKYISRQVSTFLDNLYILYFYFTLYIVLCCRVWRNKVHIKHQQLQCTLNSDLFGYYSYTWPRRTTVEVMSLHQFVLLAGLLNNCKLVFVKFSKVASLVQSSYFKAILIKTRGRFEVWMLQLCRATHERKNQFITP